MGTSLATRLTDSGSREIHSDCDTAWLVLWQANRGLLQRREHTHQVGETEAGNGEERLPEVISSSEDAIVVSAAPIAQALESRAAVVLF